MYFPYSLVFVWCLVLFLVVFQEQKQNVSEFIPVTFLRSDFPCFLHSPERSRQSSLESSMHRRGDAADSRPSGDAPGKLVSALSFVSTCFKLIQSFLVFSSSLQEPQPVLQVPPSSSVSRPSESTHRPR